MPDEDDKLQPDEEAMAHWERMKKNSPSNQALPPMTGGNRLAMWIIIAAVVLVALGLLVELVG